MHIPQSTNICCKPANCVSPELVRDCPFISLRLLSTIPSSQMAKMATEVLWAPSGPLGPTLLHPVGGHDGTSHRTRSVTSAPPSGRLSARARATFLFLFLAFMFLVLLIRCDASCVLDLHVRLKSCGYPPLELAQLHSTSSLTPVSLYQ